MGSVQDQCRISVGKTPKNRVFWPKNSEKTGSWPVFGARNGRKRGFLGFREPPRQERFSGPGREPGRGRGRGGGRKTGFPGSGRGGGKPGFPGSGREGRKNTFFRVFPILLIFIKRKSGFF